MKTKIFKVSRSKGGPQYTVKLAVGSAPSDPQWQALNLSEQDINDKAIQSVVIDLQGAMRRNWPRNEDDAQQFVDNWAAGRKQSYAVRVSEGDQQALQFTPEQVAFLKSQGVQF